MRRTKMNDVGFLYSRDEDTGEYKLLGKARGVIVEGERNCGAMTLTGGSSTIIDTSAREVGEKISADDVDVVDERCVRGFDPNKTMTFTFKPPRIIDTTAREVEVEENKSRGLRASTTIIDEFPLEEEE
jgi:hypothetical protein